MSDPQFVKVGHNFINVNAVIRVAVNREGMPEEHWGATVYTVDGKTFEAAGDEAEAILKFVSLHGIADRIKALRRE